ncbi:MAG: ribonuclease III [bacterium]|nr:MAG: ribonuclease III [bacterium]
MKKHFKDKNLYLQSLTHRSWVNENDKARGTNERLEFLGDAILEFVVSEEIYNRFPNEEEGYLTALRSNLVNTKNLSQVAEKLNLGQEIFLSKGEEDGGGRNNSSLLADTVEAVIGALYLDQGITKAKEFIDQNILIDVDQKAKMPLKDPKSLLQEKVQASNMPAPKYQVKSEEGPDHNKQFTIEVIINGKINALGVGRSKSEAEQDAASNALQNMVSS